MKLKSVIFYFILLTLLFTEKILYPQVPYVPTPEHVVEGMLSLAQVNSKDVVYDLGCGDGRIVVTAAKKYGARGIGVDNNPERIRESWANAKQSNLSSPQVDFRTQDLFQTNLRDASVVTLYLLPEINLKLRPKLFQELKPGTRIVSHSFTMDDWEPDSMIFIDSRRIYFWRIPVNASGVWDITFKDGNKGEKSSLEIDQVFQKADGTVRLGNENYYITNPKLEGNNLTFSIKSNRSEKDGNMKFNMTIMENQGKGTIFQGKEGTQQSFTAVRKTGTMKPLDPDIPRAGK